MLLPHIYYVSEEPSPELVSAFRATFPALRIGVGPSSRATVTGEERAEVEAWLADPFATTVATAPDLAPLDDGEVEPISTPDPEEP